MRPDGLADYRSHQLVDSRPVGTNPYTTEATYDTDYLWRAPPPLPIPRANGYLTPVHLRPRSSRAGEIGWHYYALSRRPDPAWTGHQILTSEFRRQLEDLNTHRYQNPWYPGEGEIADPTREGAYFRIFPHTGQRSRTSHDFRSKSGSSGSSRQYSSGPSGTPQSPHRRGRRTPAATAVTVCSDSGEVVSMEQSETEGDGRVGDEGIVCRRVVAQRYHTYVVGALRHPRLVKQRG
ncbi:hypothetical protein ACOMHN_044266 [Nucella lapillus]